MRLTPSPQVLVGLLAVAVHDFVEDADASRDPLLGGQVPLVEDDSPSIARESSSAD